MSHYDLDTLSQRELVARYVVEMRGAGHLLSYLDYEVIDRWMERSHGNGDRILLVLNEVLPDYFANMKKKQAPALLRGIEKKVNSGLTNSKAPR
jgi:hypothetical protein